jgi:hypothetical protein
LNLLPGLDNEVDQFLRDNRPRLEEVENVAQNEQPNDRGENAPLKDSAKDRGSADARATLAVVDPKEDSCNTRPEIWKRHTYLTKLLATVGGIQDFSI